MKNIVATKPVLDHFISDHVTVLTDINLKKTSSSKTEISFGKVRDINLDQFQNDIANSELVLKSSDDLETLVSQYNQCLKSIMDKHAPLITQTLNAKPKQPWKKCHHKGRKTKTLAN